MQTTSPVLSAAEWTPTSQRIKATNKGCYPFPKDWLKQFLASRHTVAPDGSPLCRYRLSDSDFETLKTALKTSALSEAYYSTMIF